MAALVRDVSLVSFKIPLILYRLLALYCLVIPNVPPFPFGALDPVWYLAYPFSDNQNLVISWMHIFHGPC